MEKTKDVFGKRILSVKVKRKIFIICMLTLPVANFFVFWVYTNFSSILLAFQTPKDGEIQWGFANFAKMIKDFSTAGQGLSIAIKNTFIYFFASNLITLPLSFLLSYFLYKKVLGYRVFRVIFYLPSIISSLVLVSAFKYFINVDAPLDVLFQKLFGKGVPHFLHDSDYATKTIVFYSVFWGLGGNLILFSGAMANIDSGIVEAAKIDGANMITEMLRIVVPLMWPTLSTVLTFSFMGIFNSSGPILAFTQGAYETQTLNYWIYSEVAYSASYYYPSAVGLVLTCIGAPIALFMRWLLSRRIDDLEY